MTTAFRVLRRWRDLSLRWQITVLVVGLIVLALAGLGLFLRLSLAGYVQASSADRLQDRKMGRLGRKDAGGMEAEIFGHCR